MRLAIFSDIHGNYQAAKTIMDDINKNNFDEIICLGDIIGIGPKPKECLELLLNSGITILAGNHDLYYKEGIEIDSQITKEGEIAHHHWVHDCIKDYIKKEDINFPLSKEIDVFGKKLLFQHYILNEKIKGHEYPFSRISINNIEDIENYCENMPCDYLFIGHEHKAFEVNRNNKKIVCVGSSGCVKDNKTFYTIIDINQKEINITKKYLEYNREKFIEDIKSYKYPDQDLICNFFFGI